MRILVISNNCFSKTENNGKTLCSIFSDFAPENIAQLYFGVSDAPYVEFCNHYYRVTEIDLLRSILNPSIPVINSHKELLPDSKGEAKHRDPRIFRKIYSKRLRLVREAVWRSNRWNSPDLREWIEEFKPDAIFAMAGLYIYVHDIAIKLSEQYDIPLFVFFTDDYVLNSTAKRVGDRIHYQLLRKQYKRTVSKAYMSYAIGEKMKRDYSVFFSKPFSVLGNSIDMKRYEHILPKKIDKNRPIIISYIGALHLNRWKSIAELGKIIKDINHAHDYNARIKVFTPITPKKKVLDLFEECGVEFCGSLDSAGVIKQMEDSHILLHVESFDKANRVYVRYSVSTKISEYLSSNRAVIAYGPHEVASMQLISDNKLGCCLTDLDSREEMVRKICNLVENYNTYDYSLPKQFVVDNYSKEVMSNRLIGDLSKAIQENNNKK